MPRRMLMIALYAIASTASAANADLVSLGDTTFGADSITRDTDQGLDFLDVTFSINRSYDDVSSQFGIGGDFAGFRYASAVEFVNLVNNYGFSPGAVVGQLAVGDTGSDQLSGLVGLLGATTINTNSGNDQIVAFTGTPSTVPDRVYDVFLRDWYDQDDLVATGTGSGILTSSAQISRASLIVRQVASVPESNWLTLMGICTIVMATKQRKRKSPGAPAGLSSSES